MDAKTAIAGSLLGKICDHHIARAESAGAKFFNKWKKNWLEFKALLKEYPALSLLLRVSIPLLVVLVWIGIILAYNDYALFGTRCEMYRAQVGVEMRRRADLIPNLAAYVNRYALYEKDVMNHVSDARQALSGPGGVNEKMAAAGAMQGTLGRLLAIVEQYPNLKAAEPVQGLIKELGNTEDRIAEIKGKYNEHARHYNQVYSSFPTNLLGWCFGIRKPMPYINTEEDLLRAYSVDVSSAQAR